MWLDQAFPHLAQESYLVSSPTEPRYKWIPYTAGDTSSWWQHLPGYR